MGKFLEDTIRSVANQTFRNFEHVVIDGDSTDNTLEILKKYPHIRYLSEPDKGYPDAFRKAIKMAKGKYMMQCCASDGYANRRWLESCITALKADSEISLVWGFGQNLAENGVAGTVNFPQFHYNPAPQKQDMFYYWLITGLGIPEQSLCTTKKIMDECYPLSNDAANSYKFLDWAEFTYNFYRKGYLPYFIPIAASFSRVHEGQLGIKIKKAGLLSIQRQDYVKKWTGFRRKLLLGNLKLWFVDRNRTRLPTVFKLKQFVSAWWKHQTDWDNWRTRFAYNFGRFKKIPKKLTEKLRGKNI
jgi:glycosyltransferase involved in cell wall biosynthesis